MSKEQASNTIFPSRASHDSASLLADWENRHPLGESFPLSLNHGMRRNWNSIEEGKNYRQSPQENHEASTLLQDGTASSATKISNKSGKIVPVSAFSMLERLRQEGSSPRDLYLIPSQINANGPRHDSTWLKLGLGITELAGEAGSGKSQMAMSLCVQTVLNFQRSGFAPGTRAIYISLSGGQASIARIAHRMQQIAEAQERYRNLQLQQNSSHDRNCQQYVHQIDSNQRLREVEKHSVLSEILTQFVRNQEDLFALLRRDLPEILEQQISGATHTIDVGGSHQTRSCSERVALIVLDSIADLFRLGNGDDSPKDSMAISKRSLVLFELASVLKELSSRYDVPVLVINQVSASFETNGTIPTLGLSWENCVNTSYLLRRQRMLSEDHNKVRQLFLTKSANHAIDRRATFQIEPRGIVSCKK